MKLCNIAEVAQHATTLNIPLTIVRGGNFNKMKSNLQKIGQHKELFADSRETRVYLLNNIDELDYILSICPNGLHKNLDKLMGMREDLPEKLSSFAIEDMEKMFNTPFSSNPYFLYLVLYAARCTRVNSISTTNNKFYRLLAEISTDKAKTFFESFITIDDEKLVPLFTLENFSINPDKVVEIVDLLNTPEYSALVRYMSQFVVVDSDSIEKVNAKSTLNILNKIYLTKVRRFVRESDRNDYMATILNLAEECGYDHKYLSGFNRNVTEEFFNSNMRLVDFVNTALGNKYYALIENSPQHYAFENLLMYALTHKKFAFLDMLAANIDVVNKMYEDNSYGFTSSILLESNVYENIINLNEVNKKDLVDLLTIKKKSYALVTPTGEKMRITPKELIALAKCGKENIERLYTRLTCKIDEKILILRQLSNVDFNFSSHSTDMDEIENLAKRLSERNIARRIEKIGYDVSYETMMNVLSLPDAFNDIVEQAESSIELDFIVRNKLEIDLDRPLKESLDHFMETDVDCKKLFELLDLSNDFLSKHATNIKNFCLMGNASIVVAYYDGVPKLQREAILKIAKAEMANEMKRFKFFNLDKELEYALSDKERDVWVANETIDKQGIFTYETYGFNDTMLIGVKPGHTCMNYKDGGHKACLLANFDSNKKILFAKVNGAIVGRAIIRLTKSLKEDEKIDKKVEFLDVEKEEVCCDTTTANERLTIFIERPYFSSVNDSTTHLIKKHFVELAMEKAKSMGARLLASNYYGDCGLASTTMNVFISHTKNGVQYMDSFGGENNASHEASYKSHSCYKAEI